MPLEVSQSRGTLSTPSPWLIALGLAAGPVVALGFTRFAYALLLPAMREDLDWSYTTAGGITTANAVGYILGAGSAAWWARTFGARQVFVGGMLISAVSLLASGVSGDFTYLTVVRFIGGLSTAVVFVVGSALASRIHATSAKHSAKLVSIYMAGVGIGVILSGFVIPAVLSHFGNRGWSAGWLVMGILAVIATVVAGIAAGRIEKAGPASANRPSMKFLLPTFAWYLLYGAGYVSYMTFVIALLNAQGLTRWSTALFFIVLGTASAAATLFLWGKIIGRLSSAQGPAVVSLVVLIGVLPVLLWGGIVPALVSAVIFGAGFMAGPTAATVIAKRSLPASAWTGGIAALTVAFSVGQGIGPVVSGIMSDTSFGISGGLWLSVVLLAVSGLIVSFQKERDGSKTA
ncbi:YbfB/YjiJ family MFS transporter [Arthrobacter crusticola]|uniref:YbfB/YjiJ family MFS transporter n=1 Tax=Arthrobacter crusticola TaxID=2547960 RepID=UPI001404BBE5|nr:YbfB/YjiJ family MFS transporter [Arthrobacter crusticola]